MAAGSGCGGGEGASGTSPGTDRTVTLAWSPSHEAGVNSAGGGYLVAISGQPAISVPYTSGPTAPTSTVTTLHTGTYTVAVSAFAALDAQGGRTGSRSVPSQPVLLVVP